MSHNYNMVSSFLRYTVRRGTKIIYLRGHEALCTFNAIGDSAYVTGVLSKTAACLTTVMRFRGLPSVDSPFDSPLL